MDKLEECDRLRRAYQQQQAAGLMTLEELGAMLKELGSTRKVAEAELNNVTALKDRVTALENDRDTYWNAWPAWCRKGWAASRGRKETGSTGCCGSRLRPLRRGTR